MMDEMTPSVAQTVAELMCASARTAPKAKADDTIHVAIVDADGRQRLAAEMETIAEEKGWKYYYRDANNVREADCVVLIGVDNKEVGLHCGGCGYDCDTLLDHVNNDTVFPGPMCIFKAIDLGIALSSAAKTASLHNADNRMMYTAGLAARRIEACKGDVVVALPISFKGKNIFFDRKW
jgi:uncharacterized ferredoxin-like protein